MTTTDRRLVTVALVALAVLVVLPVLFAGGMLAGGPMTGGHWGDGPWTAGTRTWWMVALGVLMQGLFLVALVAAGYLVYRLVAGPDGSEPTGPGGTDSGFAGAGNAGGPTGSENAGGPTGSENAGGPTGSGSADPAMEELRRAYARGDLTDEEFERRYERLAETGDRDG